MFNLFTQHMRLTLIVLRITDYKLDKFSVESSLGKSILVNSLFFTGLYFERQVLNAAVKIRHTIKIDTSTAEIEERHDKLQLTVVDTRVGLTLNFEFGSAHKLLMNLDATFAKSMNLNVLIKQSMNLIFSNQNLHCENSDL